MPKWIQWLMGFMMVLVVPWSAWTSVKVIEVDKELFALKTENKSQHLELVKDDSALLVEQRAMSEKVSAIHETVIKIDTRLKMAPIR